jgi:hypothetical protein
MTRLKVTLGLLVGAVLLASAAAGEPANTETKRTNDLKDAALRLERLKKLAGDWQLADPKDEATRGKVLARYRVTAGGSVVVETLFPGEEKEMETLYHLDGDHLMLTHYCHCGNQPRMRAQSGGDKDELVFEFAGGSNLNPAKDTHMHSYRVRFVDADHLHGEWELYTEGKSAAKHAFDLVRKK